jgi:hypothetical protein
MRIGSTVLLFWRWRSSSSLSDLSSQYDYYVKGASQLTASILACKLGGIFDTGPRPRPPIPSGPCIPPRKPPGPGRPGIEGAEAVGGKGDGRCATGGDRIFGFAAGGAGRAADGDTSTCSGGDTLASSFFSDVSPLVVSSCFSTGGAVLSVEGLDELEDCSAMLSESREGGEDMVYDDTAGDIV